MAQKPGILRRPSAPAPGEKLSDHTLSLSGRLAIPCAPRTVTVAALTRIPDELRLDIRHVHVCLRPENQPPS
jgi:hypothetical protein